MFDKLQESLIKLLEADFLFSVFSVQQSEVPKVLGHSDGARA